VTVPYRFTSPCASMMLDATLSRRRRRASEATGVREVSDVVFSAPGRCLQTAGRAASSMAARRSPGLSEECLGRRRFRRCEVRQRYHCDVVVDAPARPISPRLVQVGDEGHTRILQLVDESVEVFPSETDRVALAVGVRDVDPEETRDICERQRSCTDTQARLGILLDHTRRVPQCSGVQQRLRREHPIPLRGR